MSRIPPDPTWQEWNDICFRAARVMGISLEAIGERRVTDVLQALHAHRVVSDEQPEQCSYVNGQRCDGTAGHDGEHAYTDEYGRWIIHRRSHEY